METHQWISGFPAESRGPRLVLCHGLVAIAAKVFITSCRKGTSVRKPHLIENKIKKNHEKPRFPETNCIQPDRNIEYIYIYIYIVYCWNYGVMKRFADDRSFIRNLLTICLGMLTLVNNPFQLIPVADHKTESQFIIFIIIIIIIIITHIYIYTYIHMLYTYAYRYISISIIIYHSLSMYLHMYIILYNYIYISLCVCLYLHMYLDGSPPGWVLPAQFRFRIGRMGAHRRPRTRPGPRAPRCSPAKKCPPKPISNPNETMVKTMETMVKTMVKTSKNHPWKVGNFHKFPTSLGAFWRFLMAIELWTPGDGPIRKATPRPCRPPVPLPPAGNGLRHLGSRGIFGEFLTMDWFKGKFTGKPHI